MDTTKAVIQRPDHKPPIWVQHFEQGSGGIELCVLVDDLLNVRVVLALDTKEVMGLILNLMGSLPMGICRKFLKKHKSLFTAWQTPE